MTTRAVHRTTNADKFSLILFFFIFFVFLQPTGRRGARGLFKTLFLIAFACRDCAFYHGCGSVCGCSVVFGHEVWAFNVLVWNFLLKFPTVWRMKNIWWESFIGWKKCFKLFQFFNGKYKMYRLNSRHGHVGAFVYFPSHESIDYCYVTNEFNADDKLVKSVTCHLKFICNILE